MARGKFITIEGLEGAGKGTQIENLQDYLRSKGVEFVLTREPGGTLYAEKIRNLLLEITDETLDPVAELLMIFAARAQHLEKLIKPTLDNGTWVICDRFTDATYAYQGGGRDLGTDSVARLEDFVQGSMRPDLTILLDIDPETGLQRASERGELDRFETEQIEFFKRVRDVYHERTKARPDQYLVVDSSGSIEEVRERLVSQFAAWFDAHSGLDTEALVENHHLAGQ